MFFSPPSNSRECYARLLGGCAPGLSREHVFTSGVMGGSGMVSFRGYSKILDDTPIALARAAPKILCSTHNSMLSPLDSEAIKLSDALGEFHAARSGHFEVQIDGPLLERWLLKVTLGYLASGQTPLGRRYPSSKNLVALLFGRAEIPPLLGLYAVVGVDRHAEHTTEVLFRELTVVDPAGMTRLVGSFVTLHGVPFLLSLGGPLFPIEDYLLRPDGTSYLDPYDCTNARAVYRPPFVRLGDAQEKQIEITFDWGMTAPNHSSGIEQQM